MRLVDPDQIEATGLTHQHRQSIAYVRHAASRIGNVATCLRLLDTGDQLMPISINDGNERVDNSYVVSPLTTYCGYADYELGQLGRPWLTSVLRHLVRNIGNWLERAHIDRLVQVNNWLLSTNIYPSGWDGTDLPAITRLLVDTYPEHAIAFRSLNRYSNAKLITHMTALGYLAIPSRQVYLLDGSEGPSAAYLRRRDSRKDSRLLASTDYSLVPGEALLDADYRRLEHLYNLLYLEKYCQLNPHFSADWMRVGQDDGWLKLTALRSPTGKIDAVLGWVANEHILTTPVVGYDTSLPQKLGLYRLLSQISLEEAAKRRVLLNMSAGAADFKRMRGCQPEIEYSFVFVHHLPRERQRVWRVLGRILNAVGVPIMRKLKL